MDLDKEIIRRLKIEVAALEATLYEKNRRIDRAIEAEKNAVIAIALKYGTMTAPGTMELTAPMNILSTLYEVEVTDRPESAERVFRVRRV